MKKILYLLSFPLSVIFYLLFGLVLVFFHGLQWLTFNIFGYQAHKKTVDIMNWFILMCLGILGTRFKFVKPKNIPENVPLIIVSNHQSLWDIPPIIWYLRKYHPKFIAKKELAKGIPGVSYNLRHGGSVLIDRKDANQATNQILKIAQYITETNRSVVIFPEGTRSKTGTPRPFKKKGLETLFVHAPTAYVLPITINNSWKLQQYGMFPIPLGIHVEHITHLPLKVADYTPEELIEKIENQIKNAIK
jgi:1-acyl-sn-glycerol-3-phosphate acyltransferase